MNNDILIPNEIEVPEVLEANTELDDDLVLAREKQLNIIQKGHDSLDNLVAVADQSQHPRAYEVLSIYLKTLSELNKDLIAIAERKSFSKDEDVKDTPAVTNQLFVGSTAELAAMLKGVKSE